MGPVGSVAGSPSVGSDRKTVRAVPWARPCIPGVVPYPWRSQPWARQWAVLTFFRGLAADTRLFRQGGAAYVRALRQSDYARGSPADTRPPSAGLAFLEPSESR